MSATLGEKEPEVAKVGQSGETLMNQVSEASPDRPAISEKVSDVTQKFDDLKDKLRAKEAELEKEIDKAKEFNDKVTELDVWLDATKNKLASRGPIGTDPATVDKQLKEIEV